MSIANLGLIVTKSKLKEIEGAIQEKFENNEVGLFTDEDSKELIGLFSLENQVKTEYFTSFLNEIEVFDLYGYETSEDYDNCKYNVISSNFMSLTDALCNLKGSDFDKYFMIKLKSFSGENCFSMTFEDFIREKSPLIENYIEKINNLQRHKNALEKEIKELTILEEGRYTECGDTSIDKSQLHSIIRAESMIFNESIRDEILNLLDRDDEDLIKAVVYSERDPVRLAKIEENKAVKDTINFLTDLIENSLDIKTILGLSVSNMKDEDIKNLFSIEKMKKLYHIQPYNNKFLLFVKDDIRDELQSLYKESSPKSTINIKSRTMVEKTKNLIDYLLKSDEREEILANIL